MYGALQTYLPDGTDYDSFITTSEEKQIGIMSSIKVDQQLPMTSKTIPFWLYSVR